MSDDPTQKSWDRGSRSYKTTKFTSATSWRARNGSHDEDSTNFENWRTRDRSHDESMTPSRNWRVRNNSNNDEERSSANWRVKADVNDAVMPFSTVRRTTSDNREDSRYASRTADDMSKKDGFQKKGLTSENKDRGQRKPYDPDEVKIGYKT